MRRGPAILLATIGGVAAGGGALLLAPQLHLSTVTVHGAPPNLEEAITIATWEFLKRTASFASAPRLVLVSRERLTEDLRQRFPTLSEVNIERRIPGTVVVRLREKVPVAIVSTGGRYTSVDAAGTALAFLTPEEAVTARLPFLTDAAGTRAPELGKTLIPSAVVTLLHEVVTRLPERFAVRAEEVSLPTAGGRDVRVRTSAGWALILDAERTVAEQLDALERVFAEKIAEEDLSRLETIDVRVRGTVYYRLRGA